MEESTNNFTTEDLLLNILLSKMGEYFSGTDLARMFEVSRNAIWKAINELKKQGYIIESSPANGYRLISLSKKLDSRQVAHQLPATWDQLKVEVYDEVTSTNDVAKQFATEHPGQEALIISKKQTKGRGRSGRKFYSELTDGLYFSLVLVPKNIEIQYIPLYTLAAASAVIKAVEKECGMRLEVKWVNDLFYEKRKVSGILSEAISDIENQSISAVIVGIGLNIAGTFVKAESEVQNVAGTLFEEIPSNFNINIFLKEFLREFAFYHEDIPGKKYLQTYEQNLLGVNEQVYFTQNKQRYEGIIKGINTQGHLLVELQNGEIMELFGQDIHFSSQQFIEKKES